MRRVALGACLAAALALPASAAAAPSVSEFGGGALTNGAQIHHAVAGPDGNLWITDNWNGYVDSVTPGGTITEHNGLGPASSPEGIAVGPDNALWFVATGANKVGRMTTAGTVTFSYSLGAGRTPQQIVAGPDGALWFTESGSPGRIGRLTTSGTLSEYALPTAASSPWGITVGSDNQVWFTERTNPGKVGKIDPYSHAITEYAFPGGLLSGLPTDIASGPDGGLWLTLGANPGEIARYDTDGSGYQHWSLPTANATPLGIVAGPDGKMYFSESGGNGAVGRIAMDGSIEEFAAGTTPGFATLGTPWGIASGGDGNLWFGESASLRGIARLSIEPDVRTASPTSVSATAATLSGSVEPSSQATSAYFEYGTTTAYGAQTATASVGTGAARVTVRADVGTLAPVTTYHYRLVATNASGTRYGRDRIFNTLSSGGGGAPSQPAPQGTADPGGAHGGPAAPPPPPPAPVLGKTVTVNTAGGQITIKLPGQQSFSALGAGTTIPVGSTIDATHGDVLLTSVRDTSGTPQSGQFWGGVFQVRQRRSGVTNLYLRGGDFRHCGARPAALRRRLTAARAPRTVRRLWGRDDHGHFRTYGSHSIATVRGTEWMTADSCTGTLTRVVSGTVAVNDLNRHRTVVVNAGMSYLAGRAR